MREGALYELDVLNHLHRKGIPVAFPVAESDGSCLHDIDAPEGPHFATLFTLARGRELSCGEDPAPAARAYGDAVAAMHNAFENVRSRHSRFGIDLEPLIDRPLAHVKPILSQRAGRSKSTSSASPEPSGGPSRRSRRPISSAASATATCKATTRTSTNKAL